jgi:hypothetical protein
MLGGRSISGTEAKVACCVGDDCNGDEGVLIETEEAGLQGGEEGTLKVEIVFGGAVFYR